MAHPVYPTFPTSPAPVLGDVFEPVHGGSWTYTNIGWVKTEIVLTSDFPIYDGLVVDTQQGGGGGGGGGG
jgi:hypothetical protein